MTLNPPDLGPLQVVLHVTNEQTNATFIAAQPEVRQAIEAALPKLRDMMSDAGIQLGQTSVNAGSSNHAGNQAGTPGEQSRQAQSAGHQQDGATDIAPRSVRPRVITSGLGVVDTFA
ncbi:flagellar hook-length control protein FliK [Undibacterium arcticum]